jgi:hypothetical protein
MIRFSKLAAVFAVLPIIAVASPVFAGSPGQLAQGSGLYVVKNLTQSGAYNSVINATCNDEVQYSMQLSNTDFSALNNVMLKATFPSNGGTSTATATTELGGNTGAHDSVIVNLGSGQTISYENGTTVLYDGSGHVIKTLGDTVTTSGVNVGTINGSTTEYVNFKAKVSCPTPTPEVKFACVELSVTQIDRTRYDFTAKASVQNANVTSYNFKTTNASGTVVDNTTVTTNALSAVYHFNQSTAGTYNVSAVVNTDHGSTLASACAKQITVAAVPQVQSTTTTTPTVLPNTGAGDVLGLFAGASGLGAAGHFVTRRFRR